MKKLLKILLKVALVLLLFPLVVFWGMVMYGNYMIDVTQEKRERVGREQALAMKSGNGYGGDAGMDILDSGYRATEYFWIDDDKLLFRADYNVNLPRNTQRYFVWSTREGTIRPLMIEGDISNFYDGKLHHVAWSETRLSWKGEKKVDHFRSVLKEQNNRWVIESSENMEDIIVLPSEEYQLIWREGKPYFRMRSEFLSESEQPWHRFKYLWEWGWILRTPGAGHTNPDQINPEVGFFDIAGEIYANQPGKKVADLVDVPTNDLVHLVLIHIGFLDKYWIANRLYVGSKKNMFMGFMDRFGRFQEVMWPRNWRDYLGIPLPTTKGIFWYGQDYRLESPTIYDGGAFLKDHYGRIHKVIKGDALRSKLSGDGCRVAFLNPPLPDSRLDESLKVFDVCNSTINEKEFINVDY